MSEIKSVVYNTALKRLSESFPEDISKQLALCLVAQTQWETANYTSNVFKKNNNVGGYKTYPGSPYQKFPVPVGANAAYGYYSSYQDSVLEIADWIKRRKPDFENVKSVSDYALALKKNQYYQDTVTNYTKGLGFYYSSLVTDGFVSVENILTGKFTTDDIKPLAFLAAVIVSITFLFRRFF